MEYSMYTKNIMKKATYVALCPGTELNRYGPCGPQDFKSCVSTNSTTRANEELNIFFSTIASDPDINRGVSTNSTTRAGGLRFEVRGLNLNQISNFPPLPLKKKSR
jgi:hypothetical protein